MTEHVSGAGANGTHAVIQQQQAVVRRDREATRETWYQSAVAKRGGLETGARGWRWVMSAPAAPEANPEQSR